MVSGHCSSTRVEYRVGAGARAATRVACESKRAKAGRDRGTAGRSWFRVKARVERGSGVDHAGRAVCVSGSGAEPGSDRSWVVGFGSRALGSGLLGFRIWAGLLLGSDFILFYFLFNQIN